MHVKQKQTFRVSDEKKDVEGSKARVEIQVSREKELEMRKIVKEDLAFRQTGRRDANTETKTTL